MTASALPSGRPSHAVVMWSDDRNIYVELPTTLGVPYITKYPLNEQGLTKALNILKQRYEEAPSHEKNYTAPVVFTNHGKPPVQTSEQRAVAHNVLRKMGLLK